MGTVLSVLHQSLLIYAAVTVDGTSERALFYTHSTGEKDNI